MAPPIVIYENPWPQTKEVTDLWKSVVQHLELAETFLKLLPHLERDKNGDITDEALVYSEWRYVNYLRFLDFTGYAPCDHPPPWDVALIWYLHLLSPVRFQRQLQNYQPATVATVYGLEHRHFPLTELLKGEWSPKATRKAWEEWCPKGIKVSGARLAYQLWPSPPWETKKAANRGSGLFSRIFESKTSPSGSYKHAKAPDGTAFLPDRPITMHYWHRCSLGPNQEAPVTWDLKSYTQFRTWQNPARCRLQSQHEEFKQQCELTPWPSIHDLRADLERKIPFWRILTEMKHHQPGFEASIMYSEEDYRDFMRMFRGRRPQKSYKSRLDPKGGDEKNNNTTTKTPTKRPVPLVPPTLEIDLWLHTHRLFPARFWLYASIESGWVLDNKPLSPGAGEAMLERTRKEWKDVHKMDCPSKYALEKWVPVYVPDALEFGPPDVERGDITTLIKGRHPYKARRWPRSTRRSDYGDTGGGGGGMGAGGADAGCGGGDGGGGGGGGGGE